MESNSLTQNNIGILLTNIGSPTEPTQAAVKRYLKVFLSDPQVVKIPKFIWWPILHGLILPFRSKRSAHLYQQIWTCDGSPLSHYSTQLSQQLSLKLKMPVEIGMHYSQPSIETALEKFQAQKIKKILILPLYPQYSKTTTAVTFAQVTKALKKWRQIPEVYTIDHYFDYDHYISALCQRIQEYPLQHLVFSFHGIPKIQIKKGDPYEQHCHQTVELITKKLNLSKENWTISFQSRLGKAAWLTPYTDQILQVLPQRGITDIQVICPGFAVDCLETLEEIEMRGKKQFLKHGGKSFQYIPALNNSELHLDVLEKLIKSSFIDPFF